MQQNSVTVTPIAKSAFFPSRTALGLLVGSLVWCIYALFTRQPGPFTPHISIILTLWVARPRGPKQTAGLLAMLGLAAGLVSSVQVGVQSLGGQAGLFDVVGVYLASGVGIGLYVLMFAFMGFVIGTVEKLYREGAVL